MLPRAIPAAVLLSCSIAAYTQQQPPASPLLQFSDDLEALSSRIMPAVARISGRVYVGDKESENNNAQSDTGLLTGSTVQGSGVLVSADGYIITNAHVIAGTQNLRVEIRDTKGHLHNLAATRVGDDAEMDLAVLKVTPPPEETFTFLDISHVTQAHQGQVAIAFGSPFGFERTVTMGIVSAVRRQSSQDDPRLWIQTDAAVNPGNSGGPLVDVRGNLLGINTLIYSDTGGNEGIALAIPADTVHSVFEAIKRDGRVTRSTLSVTTHTLSRDLTRGLGLTGTQGVLVEDVWPSGSGERAGIKPGDIIQSVNGKRVTNIVNYAQTVAALKPQTSIPVVLMRGEKTLTLNVEPDRATNRSRNLTDNITYGRNLIQRLEIFAVTVDPQTSSEWNPVRSPEGVLVVARSSALRIAEQLLRIHDVIHAVNGHQVNSVEDLRKQLAQIPGRDTLVLQIERDGALSYVVLPPG